MRLQWNREWTIPSSIGVGSFLVGVGTGYILNDFRSKGVIKRFMKERESVFNEAILSTADNFLDRMDEVRDYLHDVVQRLSTEERVTVEPEPMKHPGFMAPAREQDRFDPEEDDDWDYEVEVLNRTETRPYIIHVDEFNSEEKGYGKETLTYYQADAILCDDHDVPVYGPEKVVGELTLTKFGHGSQDPSIVYVRNDENHAEYEILLEPGYFQTEVLGELTQDDFDKDVKHSLHKFREE